MSVESFYGEHADWYADMMKSEVDKALYTERLPAFVKGLESVLDVGCGTGDALKLIDKVLNGEGKLIGVDVTSAMLTLAAKQCPRAQLVQLGAAQVEQLELETPVDGVVNMFVVHHAKASELVEWFQAWAKVVKDGGRLFLAAWSGEEDAPIEYPDGMDMVAMKWSKETLSEALVEAGWVVGSVETEAEEEMGMDMVFIEATRA